MAFNPHPKVADCRDIARKWKKQQVIIFGINTEDSTIECASYGDDKVLCKDAKRLMDAAYDAILKNYDTVTSDLL